MGSYKIWFIFFTDWKGVKPETYHVSCSILERFFCLIFLDKLKHDCNGVQFSNNLVPKFLTDASCRTSPSMKLSLCWAQCAWGFQMTLEKLWKASHTGITWLAEIQKIWFSVIAVETGRLNFSRVYKFNKHNSYAILRFLHNSEVNFRENSKYFRMPVT